MTHERPAELSPIVCKGWLSNGIRDVQGRHIIRDLAPNVPVCCGVCVSWQRISVKVMSSRFSSQDRLGDIDAIASARSCACVLEEQGETVNEEALWGGRAHCARGRKRSAAVEALNHNVGFAR